jgi:hypothetical protein
MNIIFSSIDVYNILILKQYKEIDAYIIFIGKDNDYKSK